MSEGQNNRPGVDGLFWGTAGVLLLRFVFSMPHSDVLGNLGVANQVTGHGFGDFWRQGWFHRPLGYRFLIFCLTRLTELFADIRSVAGLVTFNTLVALIALLLLWAASGRSRKAQLGSFAFMVPETEVLLTFAGFLGAVWVTHQPEHYAALFGIAAYFCFRRGNIAGDALGAVLFGAAFAQKYVTGVVLPIAFIALFLVDDFTLKRFIRPSLFALVVGLGVLSVFRLHRYELRDTLTGVAIYAREATPLSALTQRLQNIPKLVASGHIYALVPVALGLTGAIIRRLGTLERVLLVCSWGLGALPLFLQWQAYGYHSGCLLLPALLHFALVRKHSVVWSDGLLSPFAFALIVPVVAGCLLQIRSYVGSDAGPVLAFGVLGSGLVYWSYYSKDLRRITLGVLLMTAGFWSLRDLGGRAEHIEDAIDEANEITKEQTLKGRGLFLVRHEELFKFSHLRSACRYSSALPALRFSKASSAEQEVMLKDQGTKENLECVKNFKGDWIIVTPDELKLDNLRMNPFVEMVRALRTNDVEVWVRKSLYKKPEEKTL